MCVARAFAAISAASWACAAGSFGQRCLAISSALTKTLPASIGARRELDEGGLTRAVGSCDKVEPVHGVAGALIFRLSVLNDSSVSTTELPSGRRSTRGGLCL